MNTYSSKQNSKKNNDNDAYHNGYETKVIAFCFFLLTIYRFPNLFVYTQRKLPYHFLDLPLSNHSCCNNLQ